MYVDLAVSVCMLVLRLEEVGGVGSLDLELFVFVISLPKWLLRIEPQSSVRVLHFLNCQDNFHPQNQEHY